MIDRWYCTLDRIGIDRLSDSRSADGSGLVDFYIGSWASYLHVYVYCVDGVPPRGYSFYLRTDRVEMCNVRKFVLTLDISLFRTARLTS